MVRLLVKMSAFSDLIVARRKSLGLGQRELAAKILREDGKAISPQYLNDIEHDRRSAPSDHIIKEFARVLEIDVDYLFYVAGDLAPDLRDVTLDEKTVKEAIVAFRRKIQEKP